MRKRLIPVLVLACTVVTLVPATASAQQTLNFSLGLFTPRGEDARVDGDVIAANRDYLFYDVNDFHAASVGGEWLVPLGNWFEAGAGIAFSRRTVDSVYTDFVDFDTGDEIRQELRLRMIPVSFTVRALPLGQSNPLQPYFGAGLAVINWRYSENGDFVDFGTPNREIRRASYVADGTATGPVIFGGLRFGGQTLTAGGEIRYQKADADLAGDFYVRPDRVLQGLGPRIDLGGWSYNFTMGVRFGR
jgi:hypothetical protein